VYLVRHAANKGFLGTSRDGGFFQGLDDVHQKASNVWKKDEG
jgi:hypothetical protein